VAESAEARKWHGIIRAAVRECVETWLLQAQARPVTVEALEGISLARSTVLLLRRLEGQPPEAVAALLPILIRTMLAAFVEVLAELQEKRA
jgi:hypothetical protein